MTVDGYSYLQDNPAPRPRRTEVMRKPSAAIRSSLMPLVIGIVVLVVGFALLKLMMDLSPDQTGERPGCASARSGDALPGQAKFPEKLSRRELFQRLRPGAHRGRDRGGANGRSHADRDSGVHAHGGSRRPSASEPEVRRAEPVHPADLRRSASCPCGDCQPFAGRESFRHSAAAKNICPESPVDTEGGRASFLSRVGWTSAVRSVQLLRKTDCRGSAR